MSISFEFPQEHESCLFKHIGENEYFHCNDSIYIKLPLLFTRASRNGSKCNSFNMTSGYISCISDMTQVKKVELSGTVKVNFI